MNTFYGLFDVIFLTSTTCLMLISIVLVSSKFVDSLLFCRLWGDLKTLPLIAGEFIVTGDLPFRKSVFFGTFSRPRCLIICGGKVQIKLDKYSLLDFSAFFSQEVRTIVETNTLFLMVKLLKVSKIYILVLTPFGLLGSTYKGKFLK